MNIPMVDLVAQYHSIRSEVNEAIQRILNNAHYILGEDVGLLEKEMVEYLECRNAIGCASGTDALQLALMALNIRPGDEIITSPFTFVATAEAIAILGARPVFVDIDEVAYNLDPSRLESVITDHTRAIIPVHLYGQCADMEPILKISQKYNLKVIEDSAQAVGAKYHGKRACSLGDIACISFFPSKNLGAYGDGGMVTTLDGDLADQIRKIAVHGSKERYKHEVVGVNSRLDSIQAAILRIKLKYLDEWNEKRRKHASRYTRLLQEVDLIPPVTVPGNEHIFHQYSIRIKNREGLMHHLKSKGIPTAIHYPLPIHLQPAFSYLGYRKGDFPLAEKVANEVLSIPMFPELTEQQIQFITTEIRNYCRS